MEISELTLKLIIILIPGAIATKIYQKISIHEKWTSFQFTVNSIILGGISYLITELIIEKCYEDHRLIKFWGNLPAENIPFDLVIKTCIIGFFLSLLVSALDRYKTVNRIAKTLLISNKYGDENLYSYFLNGRDVLEVYIRDFENNSTYHGLIDSYSEQESFCEIVLYNVAIYDNVGDNEPYYLDKIYLSRPKDKITIELPIIN
jgi:hypothetical protein